MKPPAEASASLRKYIWTQEAAYARLLQGSQEALRKQVLARKGVFFKPLPQEDLPTYLKRLRGLTGVVREPQEACYLSYDYVLDLLGAYFQERKTGEAWEEAYACLLCQGCLWSLRVKDHCLSLLQEKESLQMLKA